MNTLAQPYWIVIMDNVAAGGTDRDHSVVNTLEHAERIYELWTSLIVDEPNYEVALWGVYPDSDAILLRFWKNLDETRHWKQVVPS